MNPTKIAKSGSAITFRGRRLCRASHDRQGYRGRFKFCEIRESPGPDVVQIDLTLSYVNPATAKGDTLIPHGCGARFGRDF